MGNYTNIHNTPLQHPHQLEHNIAHSSADRCDKVVEDTGDDLVIHLASLKANHTSLSALSFCLHFHTVTNPIKHLFTSSYTITAPLFSFFISQNFPMFSALKHSRVEDCSSGGSHPHGLVNGTGFVACV